LKSLYYDARSEKHQNKYIKRCCALQTARFTKGITQYLQSHRSKACA